MLIIKKLPGFFIIYVVLFATLSEGCSERKTQNETDGAAAEIDSAHDFYEQPDDKTVYDYHRFAGIYDHESSTKGFSAILTVTERATILHSQSLSRREVAKAKRREIC